MIDNASTEKTHEPSEPVQDLPHLESDDENQRTAPPRKKRLNLRVGAALVALLLTGALGYMGLNHLNASRVSPSQSRDRKGRAVPVKIATATIQTVPIQLQAIGTVQSGLTVAVTPQASGKIIGVHFQKGEDVRKGQLLFTLDDQQPLAAIQQAEGTLAKDRALIQQARATLNKDQGLVQQAHTTLEKDQIAVQQAQANLERDQGLVKQAKANAAKSQVQAKLAQSQADRYEHLLKQGAVSQDQAQQYQTAFQAALATAQADQTAIANAEVVLKGDQAAIKNAETVVKSDHIAITNAEAVVEGDLAAIQNAQSVLASDEAVLKNLQVQLSYTKVYAPVDGRAGNILVDLGNVVQANSNSPLVNIVRVHPIQVAFSVPESNLPDIQNYADQGKLKVNITFANGNTHPIPGLLSFVNNTVDTTTGTIQLIGDFDNADGKLWPGQSVNATLTLTQEQNATVVPAQALQNGPDGQFIFVVQPDQSVAMVSVTPGVSVDGFTVIPKGVSLGDLVVIDGQANLVDGSKVQVKQPGKGNPSLSGSEQETGQKKTRNNVEPTSGASEQGTNPESIKSSPTSSDSTPKTHRKHHRRSQQNTDSANNASPGTDKGGNTP